MKSFILQYLFIGPKFCCHPTSFVILWLNLGDDDQLTRVTKDGVILWLNFARWSSYEGNYKMLKHFRWSQREITWVEDTERQSLVLFLLNVRLPVNWMCFFRLNRSNELEMKHEHKMKLLIISLTIFQNGTVVVDGLYINWISFESQANWN